MDKIIKEISYTPTHFPQIMHPSMRCMCQPLLSFPWRVSPIMLRRPLHPLQPLLLLLHPLLLLFLRDQCYKGTVSSPPDHLATVTSTFQLPIAQSLLAVPCSLTNQRPSNITNNSYCYKLQFYSHSEDGSLSTIIIKCRADYLRVLEQMLENS